MFLHQLESGVAYLGVFTKIRQVVADDIDRLLFCGLTLSSDIFFFSTARTFSASQPMAYTVSVG